MDFTTKLISEPEKQADQPRRKRLAGHEKLQSGSGRIRATSEAPETDSAAAAEARGR